MPGSGSAKANLDHGRATSARTHTPQDNTVHRYRSIVTWQESEGQWGGGGGDGAALRKDQDRTAMAKRGGLERVRI